jgi:hypothetical protein
MFTRRSISHRFVLQSKMQSSNIAVPVCNSFAVVTFQSRILSVGQGQGTGTDSKHSVATYIYGLTVLSGAQITQSRLVGNN